MEELKLLIVEDNPEAYERDIESFNRTSNIKINPTYIKDPDEAIEKLSEKEYFFDGAFVDLKLDTKEKPDDEYSGNKVLKIIKGNLRFPVFVITGTPKHIDPELSAQTSLFKIKIRGDESDYLDQMMAIYNTGITKILGRSGQIETYLNEIFWKHLTNSMDNWISDTSRSPIQKEKSLLRYTLLHMQEYIDEEIEKYHPNEFYISLPIKKNIFTGDIISYGGNIYVILTPSCDIVLRADGTRNTNMILFCKIKSLTDSVHNYNLLNSATADSNDNRKRLYRFIENNSKQNFHFIPKGSNVEAGVIDFQDKLTLRESDVNQLIIDNEIIRLATISSPFLKDIISRYSNYYSRQGSPDFSSKEVYDLLFK